MSKIFYLSEVVKFAIEKEKQSVVLYKELENKANTNDIKNFFHLLMQEEMKHEDFYTNFLNTIPKEQSAGIKEDEEYDAYMQELIDASKSVSSLNLETITSIKTVLNYAIAREKDSILFYVGLKNYIPAHDMKNIDAIIHEESQHVAKLLLLKKRL